MPLVSKIISVKCHLDKLMNQHASEAAKICSNCHLSIKRIDHLEFHKTTCVFFHSGADEQLTT